MNNNFTFVCVGQGGSNYGVEFEKLKYNTLYINSSEEDLSLLQNSPHTYHVRNGKGCRKSHEEMQKLLSFDVDNVLKFIVSQVKSQFVGLIGTSGGGTGGGSLSWLAEVLRDHFNKVYEDQVNAINAKLDAGEEYDGELPVKTIVFVITVAPSTKESGRINGNGYSCIRDLFNLKGLGPIFINDNDSNTDKDFTNFNRRFVYALDRLLSVPDTDHDSRANFDKAELHELFSTPGYATLTHLTAGQLDTQAVVNALMTPQFLVPPETDGVVHLVGYSAVNTLDENLLESKIGHFYDIHKTFNNSNDIVAIATGLTTPVTRLEFMKQRYEETVMDANNAKNKVNGALDQSFSVQSTVVQEEVATESATSRLKNMRRL